MKIITLLTTFTVAALCVPELRAQDAPPAAPEAEQSLNASNDQVHKAEAGMQRVQVEAQRAQAEVQRVLTQAKAGYADHLAKIESIRSAHHGPKGLVVVRSGEVDPKDEDNLEMDMAVMSHLLTRTLEEKVESRPHAANVLGIDVFYSPALNQMQSLYLEGYGALFMLKVNFPLLPAAKDEASKEKNSGSSEWESAKQDLYGQGRAIKYSFAGGEKYDETKVNSLKDALLQALSNGSNIRGLKPDDSLTVCVLGAHSDTQFRFKMTKAPPTATPPAQAPDQVSIYERDSSSPRQSMLTIRVKKSDVDAFAKGKLSLDEFRKRATIAVYAVSGEGNGGTTFGGGGFGGFGTWSSTAPVPPVTPIPPETPEN